MEESFTFQDENGECCQVVFSVEKDDTVIFPYGIRAELFRQGKRCSMAEAKGKFLTDKEAEETIKLLLKFQVTPCTLCDIV